MADIVLVEGILEAMKRGESLQDAMISFYNAGYERSEIEKAARAVQTGQAGQPIIPETPYIPQKKVKGESKEKQVQKFKSVSGQPVQRISAYGNNAESIRKIKEGISGAIERLNQIEFPNGMPQKIQASTPKPRVSTYGEKPKKNGAIIVIIIALIILLGLLAGVFVFKDSILDFFDKSGFFSGIFN